MKNKIFINMPIKLVSSSSNDSSEIFAIVKDLQIDIIKRNVIHIDFMKIEENQSITLKVPFFFKHEDKYKGSSGMNIVNKYLSIVCKTNNIPRFINVDMLLLPQQRKRLFVKDIRSFVDENISIVNDPDELITILK
jgi:large subunit ribosomal protein L25